MKGFLSKVPGFRSGTTWKKVVAIAYFVIVLVSMFGNGLGYGLVMLPAPFLVFSAADIIRNRGKIPVAKESIITIVIALVIMITGAAISKPATDTPPIEAGIAGDNKNNEQVQDENPQEEEPEQETAEDDPEPEPEEEPEDEPGEVPEPVPAIWSSVDEFKEKFNAASDEFETGLKIDKIEMDEEGETDQFIAFTYELNENIALVGTMNKENESLINIMMIGQGDGTQESGLAIMGVMGSVIASANPDLTPDERGDVLRDLGLLDEDSDEINGSTVRGDVKYTVSLSDVIGVMFSAEHKDR